MNSFFNWSCCTSKPAQHKEHDLNFDEETPGPGIKKKTSDGMDVELKSKGSKSKRDQHAKLLRDHALKQLRKSGPE